MNAQPKDDDKKGFTIIENNTLTEINNALQILGEKFDLRWKHQDYQFTSLTENIGLRFDTIDKKIEFLERVVNKLDSRMWQIIILLLSYPLGLIIGKLCKVF
jgi:hypothetical protein